MRVLLQIVELALLLADIIDYFMALATHHHLIIVLAINPFARRKIIGPLPDIGQQRPPLQITRHLNACRLQYRRPQIHQRHQILGFVTRLLAPTVAHNQWHVHNRIVHQPFVSHRVVT